MRPTAPARRFARRSLLAALPLCLASLAQAQGTESVDLDGTAVKLTIPAGYCKLERATPLGQAMYGTQERLQNGVNRVLLLFIDCAELKKVTSTPGQHFTHHGSYLAPLSNGKVSRVPGGMSRQQAIDEIAKSIPAMDTDEMAGRVNSRTAAEGVKVSKMSSGLLTKDANGAYLGLAANAAPASGKEAGERFRAVIFMTVLKGNVVSGNLYAPVEPGAPFDKLLQAQKKNAATVVQAN
jgi:hypothetical protein